MHALTFKADISVVVIIYLSQHLLHLLHGHLHVQVFHHLLQLLQAYETITVCVEASEGVLEICIRR